MGTFAPSHELAADGIGVLSIRDPAQGFGPERFETSGCYGEGVADAGCRSRSSPRVFGCSAQHGCVTARDSKVRGNHATVWTAIKYRCNRAGALPLAAGDHLSRNALDRLKQPQCVFPGCHCPGKLNPPPAIPAAVRPSLVSSLACCMASIGYVYGSAPSLTWLR